MRPAVGAHDSQSFSASSRPVPVNQLTLEQSGGAWGQYLVTATSVVATDRAPGTTTAFLPAANVDASGCAPARLYGMKET